MRFKTYQIYLMREIFFAILLVLLAFVALFGFFDTIEEMRHVKEGGYQAMHALIFVGLTFPGTIYEMVPIATLIGTLYSLSNLARHSEITVLRVSGLSTRDLLQTLFVVAGGMALFTFAIGEGVVPFSERTAQELRARAKTSVITQKGFESGVWVKDGRSFMNFSKITLDAELKGVRVYEFDEDAALTSVTEAKTAFYQPPGRWVLKDVQRTLLSGERASVEQLAEFELSSAITPDLISVLLVTPEKMSLLGLYSYSQHLSENRQNANRYEVALWKKFIYPLSALVMVALALPFAYTHNRVGGVSLKIFSGVMLGILFYMLNGVFSNLGAINAWPPLASAAAPSVLFMLAAVAMLGWVERR